MHADIRTDEIEPSVKTSNSLDRGRSGSESWRPSQIEAEDTDPEDSVIEEEETEEEGDEVEVEEEYREEEENHRRNTSPTPTPTSSESKHDPQGDTSKVLPFEYGEEGEENDLEDYRHHLHLFDGNYPDLSRQSAAEFDEFENNEEEYEEDSPYPEVRAAVSNMDDPLMPVNTVRMWILGLFWAIVSTRAGDQASTRASWFNLTMHRG